MSKLSRAVLALGIAAAVLLAGCATVPDVVATVNGVEISGEDYQRTLNGFLANYGLTEKSLLESLGTEEAVEYKNNVIDEMVLQELMMQYAEKNDLAGLSPEEEESVDSRVESYLADLRASFASDVETEGRLQGDAAAQEAEERFKEYVDTYGYSEENLRDQYRRQVILDRVYEDVMAGCIITEEDVRTYYNTQVARQQQTDDEDPEAALSSYLSAQESVTVYVPSQAGRDVRYVKHILVELPSDTEAEISNLEAGGNAEEAERLRTEAMEELRAQAETILERAQAGEDFDALMEQYNEDPGMSYYPEGYLVYEGASFDSAFLEEALSLGAPGDISEEPVQSSFGYHIIKYESAPSPGAVPFDEVRGQIEELLQQEGRESYWKETVAGWKDEADIQQHHFRSE